MKAAIYKGREDIEISEVPEPDVNDGEILVRVSKVGVCPTDVKAYYFGSQSIKRPIILGHEVSGVVAKSKNSKFEIGDRVNVSADNPCMKCSRCLRGLHNLCLNIQSLGINLNGGYAEFLSVPSRFIENGMVIKLSKELSFEDATFIEPTAVSIHAISLVASNYLRRAVIIGDGPNSLIHLQILKRIYKVESVTVIGLSSERLDVAKKLGADLVINLKDEKESLSSIKNMGIDLVDITIGNREAMNEAIEISDVGTRFLIFGGSLNDTQIPLTMNNVHYNQIVFAGSTGTNLSNYYKAADIVNSGVMDFRSLVTKEFKLSEIVEAFEYSKNMKGLKGIIDLS
jgi:L-iditol 2-dehydrogenase